MYMISFYVPESHCDTVKKAMFDCGAGRIGNYDSCCWSVLGQGQFRPCQGSTPYSGQPGSVSFETEYKVEMVCEDQVLRQVLEALVAAHPYEEPAYHAIKVITLKDTEELP